MAAMDGSGGVLLIPRFANVRKQYGLSLDHSELSVRLYWADQIVGPSGAPEHWKIAYSNADGKRVRSTIELRLQPLAIQVAGDRLFWIASGENVVTSCDKETANNLVTHESYRDLNLPVSNFLVVGPAPFDHGRCKRYVFRGCSHICIQMPRDEKRCLCPHGDTLMSDGETCGWS